MERRNVSSPFHYEEWLKVLQRRSQGSDKHLIIHDTTEKVLSSDNNNRVVEKTKKKETTELWLG